MSDHPLVSVIVPTYNRPDLLKETLDSIINQTYKNIEVIVIDNGSDYDFENLIKCMNDERIKGFQIQNKGIVAVNRNYGIKQASGKYIAFCDDDDIWEKEKLEIQIKELKRNSAGFCFSGYKIIDLENKILSIKKDLKAYQKSLTLSSFLFSSGYICNSSVIFEKDLINEIGLLNEDPRLIAMEDYEFYARFFNKVRMIFVPETLLKYRIHKKSISMMNNIQWLKKVIFLHKILIQDLGGNRIILLMKLLKILIEFFNRYIKYWSLKD